MVYTSSMDMHIRRWLWGAGILQAVLVGILAFLWQASGRSNVDWRAGILLAGLSAILYALGSGRTINMTEKVQCQTEGRFLHEVRVTAALSLLMSVAAGVALEIFPNRMQKRSQVVAQDDTQALRRSEHAVPHQGGHIRF